MKTINGEDHLFVVGRGNTNATKSKLSVYKKFNDWNR